jgi:lipoprotein-releasing system ATP-binding protein
MSKKSRTTAAAACSPAGAVDNGLAGRQTAGQASALHLRLVSAGSDDRPAAASPGTTQLWTVDVYKSYRKGVNVVRVLRGVSLKVRQGELLAVVGQSGSGKSTLLHILGTLDSPDKGEIHYDGRRIDDLPRSDRDRLRNGDFGMIFQFYHLLPELTTLENVLSPLMIAHGVWPYLRHRRQHTARAKELLELVRLDHRLNHRPQELSGGEMQRAAIARALVNQPRLLLADEPTGNLDQSTGQEIIRLLRVLNRERNLTIVMVTHDQAIADQADRIVRLTGGRIGS